MWMYNKMLLTEVKQNKYNCGHETLYYILSQAYQNNIKLEEFYFLSDPFAFEILDDGVTLSYSTTRKVIGAINTNIINMVDAILNNNFVILCIKSEMLFYHNIDEIKCPYHMVIANGVNLDNKNLLITDLYV